MAAETTTTFEGNLKRRYVGKTESIIPSYGICQRMMPFDTANKVGDRYEIHVRVQRPHGITAAGGATLGTSYALNGARAGQTKAAYVQPFSMTLQEQVAYDLVALAADEKTSYTPAMDGIVKSSIESARFYQELCLLYGGAHIGKIESQTGATTSRAWVITEAEWAVGIWSQMQGAALDAYDAASDGGTKQNSNAEIIVASVNPATRTVNVTGAAADLTTIDAAIAAGVYLKPVGFDGNWGLGVHRVLSHTSGSLFDISSTTYGLWKPNSYPNGSDKATIATFINAGAQVVGTGGMCEIDFLMSHWTFADLNIDSVEFRRFTKEEGLNVKVGAKSIEIEGPQGTIRLVQHPMVMAGYAYGVCAKTWKRIGATDVTWKLQGVPGSDQFLLQLPSNAGFEIRNYQNLTAFCDEPAKNVYVSGIVNQSL